MAQHILRKDLKKDEIRETFVHGVESVASHQQLLWIVLGARWSWRCRSLAGAAIPIARPRKQIRALDDAMKIFQARIRAAGEPTEPGELTYVDEKNKYTDAEKKFVEVTSLYGRTQPGQLARYYAALCEEHLNRYDDAEKNLKQLDSIKDETLSGLARFQLAAVYIQNGKGSEAVDLYKQLEDKPTIFVPKAMVMLSLADYYRKADPAQATKLYNQLKQDFPNTPAADKADEGLQLLDAKS